MLNDNQIKRVQNLYELPPIENELFCQDIENLFSSCNTRKYEFSIIVLDNKSICFFKISDTIFGSMTSVETDSNGNWKFENDINIAYRFFISDSILIGRKSSFVSPNILINDASYRYYSEEPITDEYIAMLKLQF